MNVIKGLGASKGIAKGKALIFEEGNDRIFVEGDEEKYILVAEYIPPYIAELDKRISGIIVEESSLLCHAACIAREIGIPCVTGVEECYTTLVNKEITIDGSKGEVYYVWFL